MKQQLVFLFFGLCFLSSFATEKSWSGAYNNDWNDAANWLGGLPLNGDDIIIDTAYYPSGFDPIISSASSFEPNSILIQPGGVLTINGIVVLTSDIMVEEGGTLTTTDAANGFVCFNGTSHLLGSGSFVFPNVIINEGKSLSQNGPESIFVKDSWTNNGGSFMPNTNKVVFNGSVVQQIKGSSSSQVFYDFEVAKTAQSLKIGGSLDTLTVHDFIQTSYKFHDSALTAFFILGDFIHTSGTFVACNDIYIAGNITDNHPYGGLEWGTNVTLNGSEKQVIGGAYPLTFANLILDNESTEGVVLQQPITIATAITLSNGILYSNDADLLIIKDNATASSGSVHSYVDGPIKKIGDDPFVFPLGNEGVWARLEMVNDTNFQKYSATTEFTCTYYHTAPEYHNDFERLSASIAYASNEEYWNLERTTDAGNDAQCNVRLYWEDTTISGITDLSDLLVAHYSSVLGLYENQGGIVSASGKTGTITSTIPLTSFSPITFGSGSGINPLPIKLLSFHASVNEDKTVLLKWDVATETDNDCFFVQRSSDGIEFQKLCNIKGRGNSITNTSYTFIDKSPLTGISYYRLKQVDFDGTVNWSKTIFVEEKEEKEKMVLYPNPLPSKERLFLSAYTKEEKYLQIDFLDETGNKVRSVLIHLKNGSTCLEVIKDRILFPSGKYTAIIKGASNTWYKNLIFE